MIDVFVNDAKSDGYGNNDVLKWCFNCGDKAIINADSSPNCTDGMLDHIGNPFVK